jgi:hypothetical protein
MGAARTGLSTHNLSAISIVANVVCATGAIALPYLSSIAIFLWARRARVIFGDRRHSDLGAGDALMGAASAAVRYAPPRPVIGAPCETLDGTHKAGRPQRRQPRVKRGCPNPVMG